ncbi:MAG: hypothetical protein QMB16_07765 [Paracoccaceae bacterium]
MPFAQGNSGLGAKPPTVMIVSSPRCLPELSMFCRELAIEQETYFVDASKFCEPDAWDGVHLVPKIQGVVPGDMIEMRKPIWDAAGVIMTDRRKKVLNHF